MHAYFLFSRRTYTRLHSLGIKMKESTIMKNAFVLCMLHVIVRPHENCPYSKISCLVLNFDHWPPTKSFLKAFSIYACIKYFEKIKLKMKVCFLPKEFLILEFIIARQGVSDVPWLKNWNCKRKMTTCWVTIYSPIISSL